jgi:hypothetical protein
VSVSAYLAESLGNSSTICECISGGFMMNNTNMKAMLRRSFADLIMCFLYSGIKIMKNTGVMKKIIPDN